MVICAGCDLPIYDRYLFNVLDKAWHATCIVCSDCKASLTDKCFARQGQLFCKDDFYRRFGTRCAGCDKLVEKTDMVRRARDKVFHVHCFSCSTCQKQMTTGEELYILNGNRFICKQDYYACRTVRAGSDCGSDADADDDECSDEMALKTELELPLLGITELSPNEQAQSGGSAADAAEPKEKDDAAGAATNGSGTKRRGPRTTIKAKQLETLKAAFSATPKPTRHIREQLAQETGLNMRVIQVWFQNRRSKERRMKQLRYGSYRPGRRNRGREEQMVAPHLFSDAMGREPPFYPPPVGYYCEMFGAPDGDMPMGGPPPALLLPPPDDSLDARLAQSEGHFVLDDGLRLPRSSPQTLQSAEDVFRSRRIEPVMTSVSW